MLNSTIRSLAQLQLIRSEIIYVEGYDESVGIGISIFPAGSNGNVYPRASIIGADTQMDDPVGFALDGHENLYVTNLFGGPNFLGSVAVYQAGATGNAAPTAAFTSSFDGLDGADTGIALDSSGNIYLSDVFGSGFTNTGRIDMYSGGSFATIPPTASIIGADTGLSDPFAIGLDALGNIAVLNRNSNSITVYPAGSSGDVAPKATITIDKNGGSSPSAMAVGTGGEFYVTSQGNENCNKVSCVQTTLDNVAVYPANSNGVGKPGTIIRGADTKLASPSAIAVDGSGNIYVANEGPVKCVHGCGQCLGIPAGIGSITEYGADSNGDVAPTATISGPSTGLRYPYALALDADRNIYVLNAASEGYFCAFNSLDREVRDDPILVFAAGSHGDVAPVATIHGPLTGLNPYGSDGIAIGPQGP